MQGCSNLYSFRNRQGLKCLKQPSLSACFIHPLPLSPVLDFPFFQRCSVAFPSFLSTSFNIFTSPVIQSLSFHLLPPRPSPFHIVQPSFLTMAISFLFLVVSDLNFLPPSKSMFLPGCYSTSAPVILEQPSDTVVARGEPVTLNCKVKQQSITWILTDSHSLEI